MDPSWAGRRVVARLTLLSCLGLAIYSMQFGTAMAAVVFPYIAPLAGAVVLGYTGFASWERVSGIPSQTKEIR